MFQKINRKKWKNLIFTDTGFSEKNVDIEFHNKINFCSIKLDRICQIFRKLLILYCQLKSEPQMTFFALFYGKVEVIKLLRAKINLSACQQPILT